MFLVFACSVLVWMIFFEPVESEFFHGFQVCVIVFWHEIGAVVETKISLYWVYVSVLFDFFDAFFCEFFPWTFWQTSEIVLSRSRVISTFKSGYFSFNESMSFWSSISWYLSVWTIIWWSSFFRGRGLVLGYPKQSRTTGNTPFGS